MHLHSCRKRIVISVASVLLLLLAMVWMLKGSIFTGSHNKVEQDIKKIVATSSGQSGKAHALIQTFAFDEAVQRADQVAEVQITGLLREINEPMEQTLLTAEVITSIKGNLKGNIHILQDGNSRMQFNDFPLLQPEQTYILILKKAESVPEPNAYWILGSETGIFQTIEDNVTIKWAKGDSQLRVAEVDKTKLKWNKAVTSVKEELGDSISQYLQTDKLIELVKQADREGGRYDEKE